MSRDLKPYPAYKASGVEWLEKIPKHWESKRVKYISHFQYGDSLPDEAREDGDIQVFGSNGPVGTHSKANTVAPTLIIGRKGSYGKINYSELSCFAIDTTYFVDSRSSKANLRWLWYGLSALGLDTFSQDSAVPGLSREHAYEKWLPEPPAKEQRAIAAFLDRETAKTDAMVGKKERLIELLQEKRVALIANAVTKGLDPVVPMKDSGVEWLEKIPAHWRGMPLKRWVAVKITDGPHETPEILPDGVPFISAEAVQDGRINFESKRGYISEELHRQYCRKCKPQRDDLFLCKSGATTGKLAIVDTDEEFSVWSPLAQIRANPKIAMARFLFHALQAEYIQDQIRRGWSAGTQPNIGMGIIEMIFVVAPPLEEQRVIVSVVDRETAKIDAMIAKVREGIEKLKEYRTALISAAVTGKIDVRGDLTEIDQVNPMPSRISAN